MRKFFVCTIATLLVVTLTSANKSNDEIMSLQDGMYVVNTTTLGKNIQGYVGSTPVKVYIKKNKVVKVEVLKNQETPKYVAKVKKSISNKWDGLKVKNAARQQVDAVTGATFTSQAIIKNVQLALEYYQEHK